MYCKKCGNKLEENEMYCRNCGERVENDSNINTQNSINQEVQKSNIEMMSFNTQNDSKVSMNNIMQDVSNVPNVNNNVQSESIGQGLNTPNTSLNNQTVINNVDNGMASNYMSNNQVNTQNIGVNQSVNGNFNGMQQNINNNQANQKAMYGQANNMNNINAQNKKGFFNKFVENKPLFISSIIVLAVIIIGLLIFIITKSVSNNTPNQPIAQNITTTTRPAPERTTTSSRGGSNVSNTNVETVGNYEFTIPNDLSHAIENGQLVISDKNEMAALIDVGKVDYNDISDNISSYADSLSQSGMIVNNYGLKNYSGLEYLTFEISYRGQNIVVSFYKLSDTEVTMNMLLVNGISFETGFDKLGQVLKTAKKVGTESSTSDFSIKKFGKDISKFSIDLKK